MIKKIITLAMITAGVVDVQATQMSYELSRYERTTIDQFLKILKEHKAEFDHASTNKEKREIITRPIIKYRDDVPLVHALSLSVSLAETSILKEFRSVIDDVNALDLRIRGYRQDYSMAHLALDPFVPFKMSVSIEDRLKVVCILGSKLADLSLKISCERKGRDTGDYMNVPLHCGVSRGYTGRHDRTFRNELLSSNEIYQLRACTLLFGVDPEGEIKIAGTNDLFPYYEVAFNIFKSGECDNVRIHQNAKAGFAREVKKAEEAARRMSALDL